MLKMYFILLILAFVASVKSKSDATLEWPEKYSFEITKYYITGSMQESIRIWKTEKQSRAEYNNGAVKEFVTAGSGRRSRGFRYEIHPEATDGGESELVCKKVRRSRWDSGPTDILPAADDFVSLGKEKMKDQDCTKFHREETNEYIKTAETVWAFYDTSSQAWVPTRYQKEEFNSWLGGIDNREIWDFENFDGDFDEKKVFDLGDLCSNSASDPIRMDDEAVTKHLHFIDPEVDEHLDHVFERFKSTYNKNYAHEKENAMRRNIFKNSLKLIKATNRQNLGYKLAVNQFADRTPEEIKRHTGLLKRPEGKVGTHPFPYTTEQLKAAASTLPTEFDFRLLGVISPVQNQLTCGSCWTFGTTAALEGALARKNGGKLMRLSNQALIDCAWENGGSGCDGGTDNAAYEWMMKYGMPTIAEYGTYQNEDGICHITNMTKTFKITGFVDVTPNSIEALKVALVNHGPLSVSVHVTDKFSLYQGGVFYDFDCEPTSLNHEITLVGYGEQHGETFWIVKNSWGQEWGIAGYMHIAAKDNNCGIMTEPTYVVI